METPAEPGGVALFTTSPTSTIFPLLLAQDIMVQATTSMVFGLSSTTTTVLPALLVDSSETEECVSMNDLLWEYRQDLTTRPLVMTLFAILYIVIIIFGVVGNVCVILAIARTRSLQTVPNMFIFSLSCSDVVVCCTSATITPITAFQKEWLFGRFLCSVAPFIAGVSLCFSTFTLAAISVDRFMLIRFPMKKPFTHGQAFFIICIICVLAMAMSVPVVFMQTLKQIDKYCGQFCFEDWGSSGHSQRRAYGTLMLALQFVIPLGAIVFCYTAISLRLGQSLLLKSKKKQGGGYEWQLQMTDQQRAATKRRQRTNRMFIAMVVAFSASWIWTLLFNLLRDYEILPQFVKDQEFFFGILTHCIAMTSTVWNPLLYALLNLQLRAAFVQLMPECLKHCVQSHCANSKKSQRANQYRDAGGNGSNDVPLLANDSSRRRSSPANCHATALTNCNNTTYFDRRPSQKASGGQPTNGKLLTTRSKGYEEETTVTMNGYGFHPSVAGCEYDCSPTTPSNQQRLSLSTTTATSALLTEQNGKMSNTSSTSNTPTWPINWLINRLPTLVRFLPTGQHHRYHRPRPSSIYNRKGRPMETGIERSIVNGQCSQMRSAPIVVVSSPTHPLQTAISNQRPSYRSWSVAGAPPSSTIKAGIWGEPEHQVWVNSQSPFPGPHSGDVWPNGNQTATVVNVRRFSVAGVSNSRPASSVRQSQQTPVAMWTSPNVGEVLGPSVSHIPSTRLTNITDQKMNQSSQIPMPNRTSNTSPAAKDAIHRPMLCSRNRPSTPTNRKWSGADGQAGAHYVSNCLPSPAVPPRRRSSSPAAVGPMEDVIPTQIQLQSIRSPQLTLTPECRTVPFVTITPPPNAITSDVNAVVETASWSPLVQTA